MSRRGQVIAPCGPKSDFARICGPDRYALCSSVGKGEAVRDSVKLEAREEAPEPPDWVLTDGEAPRDLAPRRQGSRELDSSSSTSTWYLLWSRGAWSVFSVNIDMAEIWEASALQAWCPTHALQVKS